MKNRDKWDGWKEEYQAAVALYQEWAEGDAQKIYIMPLEDYYPGDEAWQKFVRTHSISPLSSEKWDSSNEHEQGIVTPEGEDILRVALSFYGREHINTWINTPIEDIEFVTPADCLSDPLLYNRLRCYLMRLPV